jgi:hypothetical protein
MSGNRLEDDTLPKTRKSPLASHRCRMKRQGVVRVEVQVRKEDAAVVRSMAGALTDPERAPEARAFVRQLLAALDSKGLRALLTAAPLDGIELGRPRDVGRAAYL